MSEYELSLLRQRGLAARGSKARRGELGFTPPPGYCWGGAGRIEMDPDERVADTIRLLFRKFREFGSARQVFLWARQVALKLPVVRRNLAVCRIQWRAPAYHSVLQVLRNRSHLDAGRGRYLQNLSSLAFGGPDLRDAFLDCLQGDAVARFRAPVAGAEPAHWRF